MVHALSQAFYEPDLKYANCVKTNAEIVSIDTNIKHTVMKTFYIKHLFYPKHTMCMIIKQSNTM